MHVPIPCGLPCAWALLGEPPVLVKLVQALGCGNSVQSEDALCTLWGLQQDPLGMGATCYLAGSKTASRLAEAPCRELPWAWVRVHVHACVLTSSS